MKKQQDNKNNMQKANQQNANYGAEFATESGAQQAAQKSKAANKSQMPNQDSQQ